MESILILATHGETKLIYQLKGNINKVQSSSTAPCLKPVMEIEISGVDFEIEADILQDFAKILADMQFCKTIAEEKEKSEKAAKIADTKARIEHYQKRAAHFFDLVAQEQGKLERLKMQ
jgi:hypothetical protein